MAATEPDTGGWGGRSEWLQQKETQILVCFKENEWKMQLLQVFYTPDIVIHPEMTQLKG